jgi:hypothetical protein
MYQYLSSIGICNISDASNADNVSRAAMLGFQLGKEDCGRPSETAQLATEYARSHGGLRSLRDFANDIAPLYTTPSGFRMRLCDYDWSQIASMTFDALKRQLPEALLYDDWLTHP